MKRCIDCGAQLPDDSSFCQYCGSENLTQEVQNDTKQEELNKTRYKKCLNCGKELPEDSSFCQYCGSKRIETVEHNTEIKKRIETKGEKFKIPFMIAGIIAVCALCLAGFFYYKYQRTYELLDGYVTWSNTLKTKLSTAETNSKRYQNEATSYKNKSGYFDVIKNSASSSSNTNFFVSNTVLKNPNKTRVVFYIDYGGQYTISWQADYGITTTSGNTSSGLVYMDVTYSGSGVKKIDCTNNVNNQKITIYCIGNN